MNIRAPLVLKGGEVMADELIYKTIETGRDILLELMESDSTHREFMLTILIPSRYRDEVIDRPLYLRVVRPKDKRPSYKHPNGDVVFDTIARFRDGSNSFKISIEVKTDVFNSRYAEVRLSKDALSIANQQLN